MGGLFYLITDKSKFVPHRTDRFFRKSIPHRNLILKVLSPVPLESFNANNAEKL